MCRFHLLRPFILFALSTLLVTCKWAEPTYYQPKPVNNSWRPYVVKASMSGVPDQNIAIDTASRTLTVTLPENYSVLRADINLTLSCDSCMVGYTPKNKTLLISFPDLTVHPRTPYAFELTRTGHPEPTRYTVLLKPTGPLKISLLTEPLSAERGGDYTIPLAVSNYLDGLWTRAVFTNKTTGKVDTSTALFCDIVRTNCSDVRADRVWISVGDLLPGEYAVQLAKIGGRSATANQPLLVRRGKAQFYGTNPVVTGAQTTRVYGLNLYADRRPELLISNASGSVIRLPLINFSEDSRYADAVLPTSLSPGYYWSQLAESPDQRSLVKRFIVQRSAQQPYIAILSDSLTRYISNYDPALQTTSPIDFFTNRNYYLEFYRLSLVKKHQIRLAPVEGGQSSTLIDIVIDPKYYLYGPDGGGIPSFRIPTTVQPGRYRLTLLVYKDATTFDESEPLEREIRIR